MKKLIFLSLVILAGCSPKMGSRFTAQPNRVLYSSSEIDQVSASDSITRIRPGSFLGNNLRITLRNGERKSIPKKTVWGYSDEKGRVWRRFKSTYYQILRVSDVVEYEIIEQRAAGPNMVVNEPVRMYSKTLDSRIVGSRKRALRIGDEPKVY
ncbi:hypothetical protein [Spirosoma flavus]